MTLTFINMTNDLLITFNEVPLTESNFDEARNIQSRAKNCIRHTIDEINQVIYDSPYNSVSTVQQLEIGNNEYDFTPEVLRPEWKSFRVQHPNNQGFKSLKFISREEWWSKYWEKDSVSGENGLGKPVFVFPSSDRGFGVTPVPDKNYIVKYSYSQVQNRLINSYDTTTIPEHFNNVIQVGASYYMYQFKSDIENSQLTRQKFEFLLNRMRALLVNNMFSARDTRIR